jgi:hypothetical protein
MHRLATFFESVPSGVFRSGKHWVRCCSVLFGVASLLGCSSDESHPADCEVRTEEQALPECIGVTPIVEESADDECEFSAEISNGCDSQVELAFYCDPESSPDGRLICPEDRELAAETTETVAFGPLYGVVRWNREIAIEFVGAPDVEDEADDNDKDLQPAVSLTLVFDRTEADDVHGLCATTDFSRPQGSLSWVLGVVVLIGFVVPVRRRIRSGKDA